jgi:hypothetical protein
LYLYKLNNKTKYELLVAIISIYSIS